MNQALGSVQASSGQKDFARKYRKRLQSRDTFVTPEAWDVVSARVLADAGFDLIGVSSQAVAWSRGYKPSDRFRLDELLDVTARITDGLGVSVAADLEGAQGRDPEEIKSAVGRALAMGCVGVTFGDGGRNGLHGMMPLEEMTAAIKAARAAAMEARVPGVITASTESFLLGPLAPLGHSAFEMTVERAEAYFAAGADCVLVPGVQHLQVLERLTAVIDGPLSISIAVTLAPDMKAFAKAGVASVTLGGSMMRSLLGAMRFKAEELLAFGHFTHFDRAIPVDQLEALLRSGKP
jgi:2-methylisocitrate lyase-like PEP mutase family enzyme